MADYAGAVAAIKQRLRDNWTTTGIEFQNETPEGTWPPVDASGNLLPWVFFEVINRTSELRGAGTPGAHVWLYRGDVFAHVFVRTNSSSEIANQYAVAIGEIFRAKQFYDTDPGCAVRTGIGPAGEGPRVDGGGSDADNGNWWRVTCIIPFEFYYRG